MKKTLYFTSLFIGGCIMVTSCVDDKYDLSDIDTESAIKFDGLVVPVNLESIYLDQVLKVDDDDPSNPIKIYIDTQGNSRYAIQKSDKFHANEVYIPEIEATKGASINSLPVPVNGTSIQQAMVPYIYMIAPGKVDDSIEKLYRFGMSEPMKIDLSFYYADNSKNVDINNLVLSIPESFTAYYKGAEFTGGEIPVGLNSGMLDEPIFVYAIDFGADGIEPEGTPGNKGLTFEGMLGISSGTVESGSEGLYAQFTMSPFTVNQISGSINYEVEAPTFDPVSLEDLPDFLRESDSNLIISNPQLYFYLGNPTGAPFHTSLSIEPYGNNGSVIDIAMKPFESSIILAADPQELPLSNLYPEATIQPETGLRYILSGDGLPESINFNLSNTYLRGDVPNLVLGTYMNVEGEYTFFSPLALESSSTILYQKSETDFFGDDMKEVRVDQLRLTCYPSTNLPFDLTLTVYPLDKDGKRIKENGNEIKAEGTIKANANGSEQLDINFNQPFTGLDGVEYVVFAEFMDNEALSPEQYIKLDKIRATVSGEYVTDF